LDAVLAAILDRCCIGTPGEGFMSDRFLHSADATRASHTLQKLSRDDTAGWALAGGFAVEVHCLRGGQPPSTRWLNDIDSLPGFLAKPPNAPVYHGFQLLGDVVVDGLTLGAITDFEAEPTTTGDSFVVAPDKSRAGLPREVSGDGGFERICDETRRQMGSLSGVLPVPDDQR
jgi:hypothetical protein